jgi:hypothetical protein
LALRKFKKAFTITVKKDAQEKFEKRFGGTIPGRKLVESLKNSTFESTDIISEALQFLYIEVKVPERASDVLPIYPGNYKAGVKKRPEDCFIVKSSVQYRIARREREEQIERLQQEKETRMEARAANASAKKIAEIEKKKKAEERKANALERKRLAAEKKEATALKRKATEALGKPPPKKRGRKPKNPKPQSVEDHHDEDELLDVSFLFANPLNENIEEIPIDGA